MTQSAAQAAAFFHELAQHYVVWEVRDDVGSPAPITPSGQRAKPFWSSVARAKRAAGRWGGELRAESKPLEEWRSQELPSLERDGLLVGINWTGSRLAGWDFTVHEVLNRLAHALGEQNAGH
jgi:hypothetical protein